MARTYEISFKLGAKMAGNFAKTMSSSSGAMGQLTNEIGRLNKQQSSVQKLVKLRDTVRSTTEEFKAAKHRTEQLRKVMDALGTKEATQNFQKAERATARLKTKLDSQRQSLLAMNREMGKTKTRTADLVEEQKQLARASEKATKAQNRLSNAQSAQQANLARRNNARGAIFDAAAAAAPLVYAAREAVKFESVMADVNKVAGLQAEQLKKLEGNINQTAITTGVAREEIAAMYEAAAQAGFARKEWDAYVDTASKMSVAFDIAGEESGQMLRNWRAGMSLTMDQATALGNTVNHLSNNLNANAAAIGQVIQRQGAVAKQAGLTTQEVAGLSAALLSGGASPEIAATALKNLTGALTRGEAATKNQQKAMAKLGLDTLQMAKMMQNDATGAINTVFEALQNAPDFERNSIISQIFGEESKGAIAPLIGNMDNFRNAMKMAMQDTQSMQDEYNTRIKTSEQNLKRMAQASKVLAGAAGAALLPAINGLTQAVVPFLSAAAEWMQANPAITTGIMAVVASLVAFKVATSAGLYVWTLIKGAWLAGAVALNTVRVAMLLSTGATIAQTNASKAAIVVSKAMAAAQWLFNAALAANPIGLVIAGIAALIAAGVALYRNWDTVKTFLLNAWGSIKDWWANFSLYDSGVALLKTLGDGIVAGVKFAISPMKWALDKVREFLPFSDAKTGPLSELTKSGSAIMTTLSDGMGKVNANTMMQPFNKTTAAMVSGFGQGGAANDTAPSNTLGSLSGQLNKAMPSINNGGAITLQVTQEINIGSDAGPSVQQQAREGARQGAQDMLSQLNNAMKRESRLSYG